MAYVLLITGFNRSGTTLLTAAVAQATQARTLTVGDLARNLPSVRRFLSAAGKRGAIPDRGVDRLQVTESTPEEYGWLLREATGDFAFGAQAARDGVLDALIAELAELAGGGDVTVVLKNPSDTCRERLLLEHFSSARILLVRRNLNAIEDSQSRAWDRMATSSRYTRALIGDSRRAAEFLSTVTDPSARRRAVRDLRRKTRRDAIRLARGVSRLPPGRVAFLSYDELRADPYAGARWAAHILDPNALGDAVAEHSFPEYNGAGARSITASVIDWYWARAWRRARTRQVRAGVLAPSRPDTTAGLRRA